MDDDYQPKPPKAMWPIFVTAIVLFVLFLAGTQLLLDIGGPLPDEDAARSAERTKALADYQAQNAEKLGGYAWVDRAKGSVQIPITQAMQVAAARLAGETPRPMTAPPPAESVPTEPLPAADPAVQPAPPAP